MLNPLTGQVEPNGTSIVDVTDPRNPRYLTHIPGEAGEGEGGGAQMTRLCDGSALPRSASLNPSLTISANALRIGAHLAQLSAPTHDRAFRSLPVWHPQPALTIG